jgi:phosphoglycolate phosphatase
MPIQPNQMTYLCRMEQQAFLFRSVLFDLDGTLINSLHDIADSMNRVLTAKGFRTHDYDAYRYFIGRGLRNLVVASIPEKNRCEQNIKNLFQELLQDYKKNLLHKTSLYKGIPELLDKLSERGIRMSILSNKPDALTHQIASELLKPWTFDIIMGSGETFPRKPDPAAALYISKTTSCPPESFLYLGDTSIDMQTALAAGMYPVGATWGFRTKEELLENGASALVDSPSELVRFWE